MPETHKPLRFLIVNNHSSFASKDIWEAFAATCEQDQGIYCIKYPIHIVGGFFQKDMLEHHLVASAVSASTVNQFTHVIFIGSTFMSPWVMQTIKNMPTVKSVYWSLEDPHALDQNIPFKDLCDYYFTNEREVAKQIPGTYYLPTAGGHIDCRPPSVQLKDMPEMNQRVLGNDVVFCGNIYPNRQKVLEAVLPHFEKHGIRLGLMGISKLMKDPDKSPLMNYFKSDQSGVVDHRWVIAMYGYSKFVINIERDPHYEWNTEVSSNRIHNVVGESLNPRAYEIALCGGGLQLIDDRRVELQRPGILEPGKHCVVYTSPEDMVNKILYYREHEEERVKIVKAARSHALKNHTYHSRAQRMIDILHWQEGRKDLVAKAVLDRFLKGKINIQ